jgi:hypothetical protein
MPAFAVTAPASGELLTAWAGTITEYPQRFFLSKLRDCGSAIGLRDQISIPLVASGTRPDGAHSDRGVSSRFSLQLNSIRNHVAIFDGQCGVDHSVVCRIWYVGDKKRVLLELICRISPYEFENISLEKI